MRINCGGFELNENDFELNGETLSLKNSGRGEGSGNALIVTIYADNAQDIIDETGKTDPTMHVKIKMNQTFGTILNAYEKNRAVLYQFEWAKLTASGWANIDQTLAEAIGQPCLVLHSYNGEILNSDNAVQVSSSTELSPPISKIFTAVTTECYNKNLKPDGDEFVLIRNDSWSPNEISIGKVLDDYGIYYEAKAFSKVFTCASFDEYPECWIVNTALIGLGGR